jgi:hypothetical protein
VACEKLFLSVRYSEVHFCVAAFRRIFVSEAPAAEREVVGSGNSYPSGAPSFGKLSAPRDLADHHGKDERRI